MSAPRSGNVNQRHRDPLQTEAFRGSTLPLQSLPRILRKRSSDVDNDLSSAPKKVRGATVVLPPTDDDVVVGTGGNAHFREIVEKYRPDFCSPEAKDDFKSLVVDSVLAQVRSVGGRFLTRNKADGSWREEAGEGSVDAAARREIVRAMGEGTSSRREVSPNDDNMDLSDDEEPNRSVDNARAGVSPVAIKTEENDDFDDDASTQSNSSSIASFYEPSIYVRLPPYQARNVDFPPGSKALVAHPKRGRIFVTVRDVFLREDNMTVAYTVVETGHDGTSDAVHKRIPELFLSRFESPSNNIEFDPPDKENESESRQRQQEIRLQQEQARQRQQEMQRLKEKKIHLQECLEQQKQEHQLEHQRHEQQQQQEQQLQQQRLRQDQCQQKCFNTSRDESSSPHTVPSLPIIRLDRPPPEQQHFHKDDDGSQSSQHRQTSSSHDPGYEARQLTGRQLEYYRLQQEQQQQLQRKDGEHSQGSQHRRDSSVQNISLNGRQHQQQSQQHRDSHHQNIREDDNSSQRSRQHQPDAAQDMDRDRTLQQQQQEQHHPWQKSREQQAQARAVSRSVSSVHLEDVRASSEETATTVTDLAQTQTYTNAAAETQRQLHPVAQPPPYSRSSSMAPKVTLKIKLPKNGIKYSDVGFHILGRKGVTHRQIQSETETKIALLGAEFKLRNKGNDNMFRKNGADIRPHIVITGGRQQSVDRAARRIERQILAAVGAKYREDLKRDLRRLNPSLAGNNDGNKTPSLIPRQVETGDIAGET